MPERIVTDATGDRWDVKEEARASGQDGTEREGQAGGGNDFRLSFRHQSGRRLELDSAQGVNALSDRELLAMLAEGSGDREVTEGAERSADADGYITG